MITWSKFTYVPLSKMQGFAKIDIEDLEKVKSYSKKWYRCNAYAACWKDGKNILMHRILIDAEKGIDIDHKNHNGLDNRKENLRAVTRSQNSYNSYPKRNNKHKGITFIKRAKKWAAKIGINYRQVHLGYFSNINDAMEAYDKAAIKYYGEYAFTNKEIGF